MIKKNILLTKQAQVLDLDIIDLYRQDCSHKKPSEKLSVISSWLTCNGQGGFFASWLEIDDWGKYKRNDFPKWHHIGSHEQVALDYWNWFISTKIDQRDKLIFQDSPDFRGIMGQTNFWGDIGKVSFMAFLETIRGMSRGDLWISLLGNGKYQILLESLYSPKLFQKKVPINQHGLSENISINYKSFCIEKT